MALTGCDIGVRESRDIASANNDERSDCSPIIESPAHKSVPGASETALE